jgi:hypothetical protein
MAIQEWVPSTRSDGTRYKDNFLSAGGTCTQPELRQLQVSPPSATSLALAHQSAHSFPNPQPASAHHMSTLVRNLGPPCAQRPPALARWPPTLLEQDRPLPRGPTSTCACHCHPLCSVIGHRCNSPPSPPPLRQSASGQGPPRLARLLRLPPHSPTRRCPGCSARLPLTPAVVSLRATHRAILTDHVRQPQPVHL